MFIRQGIQSLERTESQASFSMAFINRSSTLTEHASVNSYDDSSDYTYVYPFSTTWLAIVPLVVSFISVVTIIGNFMVIVAYTRDQQIRANVANLFIFNLAITDFIVGALVTTVNLSWLIKDTWVLGEVFCKLWLVLDYTVVMVSVWTMVMISWDPLLPLDIGSKVSEFSDQEANWTDPGRHMGVYFHLVLNTCIRMGPNNWTKPDRLYRRL